MSLKNLVKFYIVIVNIVLLNSLYANEFFNFTNSTLDINNAYEKFIMERVLGNASVYGETLVNDTIYNDKVLSYDTLILNDGVRLELLNGSRLTIEAAGFMSMGAGASLLVNGSTLQNAATFNNYMLMHDGPSMINVINDSYLSVNEVRNWVEIRDADGNVSYTSYSNVFNLYVKNSTVSYNDIYFKPQGTPSNPQSADSVIITVENDVEQKGNYNVVINGAEVIDRNGILRKIAVQTSALAIDIVNGDLKIRGDIVGNDSNSRVDRIDLVNSNFEFTGNLIENVRSINLVENSLFTFGLDEDFKSRVIELGSGFNFISETSDAKLGTMKMISDISSIKFDLRAESALEAGDLIYTPIDSTGSSVIPGIDATMNIYIIATGTSSFKIDNVDVRGYRGCGAKSGTKCEEQYPDGLDIFQMSNESIPGVIRLQGSSDSNLTMKDIYIDNNYTSMYFIYAGGFPQINIDNIYYSDYENNNTALNTTTNQMNFAGNPSDKQKIKINNIHMNTTEDSVYINLKDTRFMVMDTLYIESADNSNQDVFFRGYASEVFVANLKCSTTCNNFDFAPGDPNVPSINTLIFNNIYSYSENLSTNEFHLDSFRITVNDNFNYNGHLSLQDDAKLVVGHYNGVMYGADITNASTLEINKSSSITMEGDINISNGSHLIIKASDVFYDPLNHQVNIFLTTNSDVLIDGKNYIDNIDAKDYSVITLKNGVSAGYIFSDDTSIANFYQNTYIKELHNQNELNIYGYTSVDYFVNESKKVNFYVDANYYDNNTDCGSLFCVSNIDSSNANDKVQISVNFVNTTMFKPGHINTFNVYHSDVGSLGIDENYLEESLSILPPWLQEQHTVEQNSTGGEDLIVNVERLTDYTTLMYYMGNEDSQVADMARVIDNIVEQERVPVDGAMVDIVNSLDYNSGCVVGTDQEEIIYEINNGDPSRIDEVTCLVGLQNNFLSMKPIHNEVFLNYMHNNVSQNMDILLDENRNYYGLNETNFWIKDSVSGSSLISKQEVIGYHSFSNDIQVGLTGSYFRNINTTLMFGVSPGTIGSQSNFYDSTANVVHFGASASYINYYLFSTIALMASTSKFHNTRHLEFLVNDYSSSGGNSFSDNNVSEVALRFEVGTEWSISKVKIPEYILPDSVIDELNIVPKAFIQISDVKGESFAETGSSGSMTYEGFNTAILDIGVGIDFYEEILIDEFLSIQDGFWQPKAGINVKDRYYKTPGSVVYFNDYQQSQDAITSSSQNNAYTGVEMEATFSLGVTKNKFSLVGQYSFARGYGGYMNNTLDFTFRYAFK